VVRCDSNPAQTAPQFTLPDRRTAKPVSLSDYARGRKGPSCTSTLPAMTPGCTKAGPVDFRDSLPVAGRVPATRWLGPCLPNKPEKLAKFRGGGKRDALTLSRCCPTRNRQVLEGPTGALYGEKKL